jgi:hypothetical protein
LLTTATIRAGSGIVVGLVSFLINGSVVYELSGSSWKFDWFFMGQMIKTVKIADNGAVWAAGYTISNYLDPHDGVIAYRVNGHWNEMELPAAPISNWGVWELAILPAE